MCFEPAGGNENNIESQRVCVCDCVNGRFITNLTKAEIEYIFDVVAKQAINSGEYIRDVVVEGAVEKLGDMKDYVNLSDRDQ